MVGLTGGIGAGKSTVAALLAARGAIVIDADAIAREVVEPGRPALAALVERFGTEILAADGTLDRPALAARAFADEESRRDLEAITHPAIGKEFLRRIQAAPAGAVVIHDVPLLAEAARRSDQNAKGGARPGYAAVIVVEGPRELRLDRLERRGVSRDDAEARMAVQASDEERRALATWVIDNSGDLEALERQVDEVWSALSRMAQDTDGAAGRAEPHESAPSAGTAATGDRAESEG